MSFSVVESFGRLRDGADGDVHAESFELTHEPACLVLGAAVPVVPVRPEVLVGHPVTDDVVVGDEDVVTGRADGFLGAAPAPDLGMVGGQVGTLRAGRGLGGWCFSRKVTKRTDDQGVYQCVSLYVISVFLAQRRLAPAS